MFTPRRRPVTAVLTGLMLVVASCSGEGGSDESASTDVPQPTVSEAAGNTGDTEADDAATDATEATTTTTTTTATTTTTTLPPPPTATVARRPAGPRRCSRVRDRL